MYSVRLRLLRVYAHSVYRTYTTLTAPLRRVDPGGDGSIVLCGCHDLISVRKSGMGDASRYTDEATLKIHVLKDEGAKNHVPTRKESKTRTGVVGPLTTSDDANRCSKLASSDQAAGKLPGSWHDWARDSDDHVFLSKSSLSISLRSWHVIHAHHYLELL